jgi:hypothetical protein
VQVLEDLEGAEPAVLVVDRGDPAGGGHPEAFSARLNHLVERGEAVHVAEPPGRVLAQHAGRLAAVVALDHAAGDVEVAAGPRERRRVQPQRVVVPRHERHRHVRGHGVQRGGVRRLCPAGVAPAEPAQPAARRQRGQRFGHARHSLGARLHAFEPYLPQPERPGREVDVRVVEARHHAAAAQVDAPRAGRRLHRDPAVPDGEPRHQRRRGVERPDRAALEDEPYCWIRQT